jgi:hypothetical protein
MSPVREMILSLTDVEAYIERLESKYGVTTSEFLADRSSVEGKIEEDDIFKWEIYIAHRRELRRINEGLRHAYLSNVTLQDSQPKSPTLEDQFLLAA